MYDSIQKKQKFLNSRSLITSEEDKKLYLLSEITKYEKKVSKLKQLEIEVKKLTEALSIQSKQKQKAEIKSERSLIVQKPRRSSKTSLKIKGYEIQKKLAVKTKQCHDKQGTNQKKLKEYKQVAILISDLEKVIENQKKYLRDRQKLQKSMQLRKKRLQNRLDEEKKLVQQEAAIFNQFQHKKNATINSIKTIKKQLRESMQDTLPAQDENQENLVELENLSSQHKNYYISQDQIYEHENQSDYELLQCQQLNKKLKLSCQNSDIDLILSPNSSRFNNNLSDSSYRDRFKSPQKTLNIWKKDKPIDTSRSQNSSIYFTFKKNNCQANSPTNYQNNCEENLELLYQKEYDQQILLQKIPKTQQKLMKIKKYNINAEHKLKHKKMTVDLLKGQFESRIGQVENEKIYLNDVARQNGDYRKLIFNINQQSGELAKIRGLIGVKVQNNKTVSIINEQIQSRIYKLFFQYQNFLKILQFLEGI